MNRPPKPSHAAALARVLEVVRDFASEEWTTRVVLVNIAGMPDRQFRKAVEELVRQGWPIASCHQKGYRYCVGNTEALEGAARELEAKAHSLLRRARSIRDTVERMIAERRRQGEIPFDEPRAVAYGSAR